MSDLSFEKLIKNGLTFDDIKPFLRQLPYKDLHWNIDQESLYELIHGPEYSYCYMNMDYNKLDNLFQKVNGYIIWESICTDTQVGRYAYEYEGVLVFSTIQYYRKGNTSLVIHNEDKYKEFRDELKKCIIPEEGSEIEIEEFTTNRIVWTVDYVQSATREILFLCDNGLMYEIDWVNRKGHSLFDATVTYFDENGYLREYSGDCKYRIVDSIFSDEYMLKHLKNKNINDFLVEGNKLTSQTGE